MTPEGGLVKACLAYLKVRGIFAWRNNSRVLPLEGKGGRKGLYRFGVKGGGDIFGVLPGGRFLSIECKTAKGKTSLDQEAWMNEVNDQGGLARVVRSIEELEGIINE